MSSEIKCGECGHVGVDDAEHVVRLHRMLMAANGQVARAERVIKALRDVIGSQKKTEKIFQQATLLGLQRRQLDAFGQCAVQLAMTRPIWTGTPHEQICNDVLDAAGFKFMRVEPVPAKEADVAVELEDANRIQS